MIEAIQSEIDDETKGAIHYEIQTYPADYTVELLVQKYAKGDIKIPNMQRLFVWKQPQSSKLIESFLTGLPVPPIYLFVEGETQDLLVIDGQQRLRTVAYYLNGYYGEEQHGKRRVFSLILDDKSPYNGLTFNELTKPDQKRLQNAGIRAFIMLKTSPNDETSINEIYERLNTGGTQLNPQEVRNCVSDGSFNDLLHALNENDEWRDIVGRKPPDNRFRDIELILRFLALYEKSDQYEKPLKIFLNKFMAANRKGDKNAEYTELFNNVVSNVRKCLGPKPFHIRQGLNAAVFDGVFVAFARNRAKVTPEVKHRFEKLIVDEAILDLTEKSTTNTDTVKNRLALVEDLLFG
jgi:uncharacterized protein with ParB-like and HNH nuclease domain